MSERETSATGTTLNGRRFSVADHGLRSREEMLVLYREYYEQQLREAQMALSVPDENVVVETYLGAWAMKNKRVIA